MYTYICRLYMYIHMYIHRYFILYIYIRIRIHFLFICSFFHLFVYQFTYSHKGLSNYLSHVEEYLRYTIQAEKKDLANRPAAGTAKSTSSC